jgi:hypothetical protein
MKYRFILILLIGTTQISTFSQTNFPIKIAISNEATAVPFTRFFTTPVHPAIQVGTEYFYKNGPHFDFYQTGNLAYYFHNYLYQGICLNTGAGYDYKFDFGLKLKSAIELGYLHTFTTQDEYQLQNGEYVNEKDRGNLRFMPMLSLGFGYIIKHENVTHSEIFLLYKSWVEYPYSPGFIPVMTHINLEIGYKFYINRHDEK